MAETRDVSKLQPHPLNAQLYAPPSGPEFDDLKRSIAEQGILVPITIDAAGTIYSGHRRWEAVRQLGWTEVAVEIISPDSDLAGEKLLIEFNRYRRKTFSELMNEGRHLERIEAALARDRQGTRTDAGYEMATAPATTRDRVGNVIGVSGRTYDKMKAVFDAAQGNELIKLKVGALDRGETSLESVFQLVNQLHKPVLDFEPKIYDIWNFGGLNPKYGKPHPGQLPGDLVENVVYYFTGEGDIVADPFAGGGITIDVCKAHNRVCYASDLVPKREDIFYWDITGGFPPYEHAPHLIFLDPPYWNMVAEEYDPNSVSSLPLDGFIKFMRKLSHDTYAALRPGGIAAGIIMKQKFRLPEGVPVVDWPIIWERMMSEAGFIQLDRIICGWPTSIWKAYHVEKAKEDRRILPIAGDMLIMGKPMEDTQYDIPNATTDDTKLES